MRGPNENGKRVRFTKSQLASQHRKAINRCRGAAALILTMREQEYIAGYMANFDGDNVVSDEYKTWVSNARWEAWELGLTQNKPELHNSEN